MESYNMNEFGQVVDLMEKKNNEELERETMENLKISLHAITGCANPKTMRVMGRVETCPVVILIDIGSTHNFIDFNIITRTWLGVNKGEQGAVKVAKVKKWLVMEGLIN